MLKQISTVLLALALSGCAVVDPRSDYKRVQDLLAESVGRREVYLPDDDELVARRVDELLDGGVTTDDAVRICLLNNPTLQAAFFEIGMARADVVQAGLLSNPTIGLSLRLPSGGGLANFEAGLTQNIAELWQIPARRRAAERRLDAKILDVARRLGSAAVEARATYFRAVAADRLEGIARENLRIAEQLADMTLTRRRAGAGSKMEVNLSRAEVLEVRLTLRAAETRAFESRRDLAVLMGLATPFAALEMVDDLPDALAWTVDRDRLVALAMEHRLDIRSAQSAVYAARAKHKMELSRVFQSVQVGVALERAERSRSKGRDIPSEIVHNSLQSGSLARPSAVADNDKNTDFIIGPSLSLELPIFDQNRAQIAKAQYAHRRAIKQYDALVRTVFQDAYLAYEKGRIAADVARFFHEELLPLRQSNLDLVREAFRAGRANLVLVLDAQRSLIDSRARYVEAQRDAAVTLTELEKVAGRPMVEILNATAGTRDLTEEVNLRKEDEDE